MCRGTTPSLFLFVERGPAENQQQTTSESKQAGRRDANPYLEARGETASQNTQTVPPTHQTKRGGSFFPSGRCCVRGDVAWCGACTGKGERRRSRVSQGRCVPVSGPCRRGVGGGGAQPDRSLVCLFSTMFTYPSIYVQRKMPTSRKIKRPVPFISVLCVFLLGLFVVVVVVCPLSITRAARTSPKSTGSPPRAAPGA